MTTPGEPSVHSIRNLVRMMSDIQWMSRRGASRNAVSSEEKTQVDDATWLLQRRLATLRYTELHPDGTANQEYDKIAGELIETPSIWTDGVDPVAGHIPDPAKVSAWDQMSEAEELQAIAQGLHPSAHRYADGRMTYATSMFNMATAALLNNGVNLDTTAQRTGGRLWVEDGMGESFDYRASVTAAQRHGTSA